jgi:hypothetical protein
MDAQNRLQVGRPLRLDRRGDRKPDGKPLMLVLKTISK